MLIETADTIKKESESELAAYAENTTKQSEQKKPSTGQEKTEPQKKQDQGRGRDMKSYMVLPITSFPFSNRGKEVRRMLQEKVTVTQASATHVYQATNQPSTAFQQSTDYKHKAAPKSSQSRNKNKRASTSLNTYSESSNTNCDLVHKKSSQNNFVTVSNQSEKS